MYPLNLKINHSFDKIAHILSNSYIFNLSSDSIQILDSGRIQIFVPSFVTVIVEI